MCQLSGNVTLLSTGGIIYPSPGCGEGMVLEDNPGRNVRCASCQVMSHC